MLSELDVLKDVCERLDRAGIAYMITGSVAMNYYAQPRMTRDIDIVVKLTSEDGPRIQIAFKEDYYLPTDEIAEAVRLEHMFNIVHLDSVVKIDMIVCKSAKYRQTEFSRRQEIELPGFRAWIVSKEDLILSKLVWALDSHSELQLRDVRNLLATGTDMEYLSKWAKMLEVETLLRECRDE